LGPLGKWMFLLGAAGAVFSSLLGVWQAAPYLFADTWTLIRARPGADAAWERPVAVDTRLLPYRAYQLAIAVVPMLGLFWSFREVQKIYAIIGASFIPLLALVLLILNGRSEWVGADFVNRMPTVAVLLATLAFSSWIAFRTLASYG
ncbi:MAG: hypothetical protein V3V67_01800, partial [Myxococcota bacterium]